jgi:transposase InsO family protein
MSRQKHTAEEIINKLREAEVLQAKGMSITELFITRGTPAHIRSDNGPEFVAETVRSWLGRLGVQLLFIEPGSPWKNGYIESFNGKFRDELLNGEVFDTLTEARVVTERWRKYYNTIRPHSSLGRRPSAPETFYHLQLAHA